MSVPTAHERETLFRQVLDAAVERTGAARGALYVLDPKADQHYLQCQLGFGPDDYVHYKLRGADPVVTRLRAATGALVADGATGDPALLDYMSEAGVDRVIFAPLVARQTMVGILELRDKPAAFSERDVTMAAQAGRHAASVAMTIPAIEAVLPPPEPAAPAAVPVEAGADEPTQSLSREETGLSTAVMKTLRSTGSIPRVEVLAAQAATSATQAMPAVRDAPAAASPAATAPEVTESKARQERRRRPIVLPVDLLREVMPVLFRMIPIDSAAVGLCEEGILALSYVGPAALTDTLWKEVCARTHETLRAGSYPGGALEIVADDPVVLEAAAVPLEGKVSRVHPITVALPRMRSETQTILVIAGIQVDRLGFAEDSAELLAMFASTIKNLFLQRLRSQEYRSGYLSLLNQVLKPIEKTLPYVKSHSIAVANYSKQMAIRLGMDEMEVENIIVAAILHDIGLLELDYEILREKGKLSEKDLHEIRKHPIFSRDYAEQVAFPYPVGPLVYSHHERWDGKGYPEGLRGEAIPLGARIISVAEAFDAMTSRHSYRAAMPAAAAIEELRKNAGTQFDARVVDVFISVMRRPKK